MPITLKLKNPKAGSPAVAGSTPTPAAQAPAQPQPPSAPSPSTSSPISPTATRRSVSFAGVTAPASADQPLPKRHKTEESSVAATTRSAPRQRSPTPPSHANAHCLPIPSKKKSRPTTITSSDITHALEILVLRYARLAGYDAVQAGVLDVLRRWLQLYLRQVAEMSEDFALLSGRAWPGARDLVEAVKFQGQVRRRDDDSNGDECDPAQPPPLDASHLIAWRHTIPDYHDEYANRERHSSASASASSSRSNTPPTWADTQQVALVEPSEPIEQDQGTALSLALLSRKNRMKEKIHRDEIPDHLPDLPALHTWKRTDAYPTNKMLSAQTSTTTGTSSGTLSRLESRLVSSRLVQTSLRSLIGRLDGAGGGMPMGDATSQTSSPFGGGGTVKDLPAESAPPPRHARSTSRADASGADGTRSPTTMTTASLPRSGRLSIRLRNNTASSTDTYGSPLPASPAATTPTTEQAPASTHRRSLSLKGTTATTTTASIAHLMPLQSPASVAPWMNPLMSPVTPRTAGPQSASGAQSAWPFTSADSPLSATPGKSPWDTGAMPALAQTTVAIPPPVNFKAGWYGRRG